MTPVRLTTYYRSNEIPPLPGNNTFHSKELFKMYEATPKDIPLLIVASLDDKPIAKLLACVRPCRGSFLMPFMKRCDVYGTGDYWDDRIPKDLIFNEMLERLTQEVEHYALFIEFKNLDNALFGYKYFRKNRYFPVNWLKVKNIFLPDEKLSKDFSPSRIRQIKKGLKSGVLISEATSRDEITAFGKMLHRIYSYNIRRQFPNIAFFYKMKEELIDTGRAKIFLVSYKHKIIGGSVCVYSEGKAYIWYSGGMRKSYANQYPGVIAVWTALKDAKESGCQSLEFIDVGIPFHKHGYRSFVLRFGGQQSSTRRWFHVRWRWLNNFLIKIYV